jgi:hypothetical protein
MKVIQCPQRSSPNPRVVETDVRRQARRLLRRGRGRRLERLDALISETDDEGRPLAYNRVAGVVVTGNEDGAHHVVSEIAGVLIDVGSTIPGQAWTYWNRGGEAAAANLVASARALAANPIPAPPGS